MDGQGPSGRRRVQGEDLAPKSRIGKTSRCDVPISRSGRRISVVRGPRRTVASQRWRGAELVRGSDRYRRSEKGRGGPSGKRIQAPSNHRNGAQLALVTGARWRTNTTQSPGFGLYRCAI